ncbi:hypothetical protein [Gilliamella sp. wkB171]|nr:hypothetical protein [Gilliamella apicola]
MNSLGIQQEAINLFNGRILSRGKVSMCYPRTAMQNIITNNNANGSLQ